MTGRVAAVVPGAARAERPGPSAPPALRLLGGVPMLVHAARALAAARLVDLVVVAVPPADVEAVETLLAGHAADATVVAGGATRQECVARALAALPPDVDVVLVHDPVRPLAPPELADSVVRTVREGADAVVPVLPVTDTVKRVDEAARVVGTVARDALRAVQTPQGFLRTVLAAAHEAATAGGPVASDDAGLVARLGRPVWTVLGSEEAFTVTRPGDLLLAETVLGRQRVR